MGGPADTWAGTGTSPGGTVRTGESPREAAHRETSEEAGLHVRITDKLTHFTNADTGGRPICFHTVTYRAEEVSESPVVLRPVEHDEYQWATPEQALALDLVWHARHTVIGLLRPGDSAEASTS
ncbi:NUDIX hydrolase [Pseudonocardia sp. Ae707_Ps1]|uniref:NUDIX hydrolase n=1 Tax=Pseudonocardia sp. Ae707_Ps1 TaxID=1885572 RepID=UPI0020160D9F|nr:NUDIX hydrolase [Pseudonocardia sp. Ae707_Ps1]